MTTPVFELEGVSKVFGSSGIFGGSGLVRALDNITTSVEEGLTVALVGESGSGKSTLARVLLRLEKPTQGLVRYRGRDLWGMTKDELNAYRRAVQVVFQDPYASLNSAMTVERIVAEPLRIQNVASGRELSRRVAEALDLVGLDAADGTRKPREFSGGQRQRIAIARAISLNPQVLILDEPTSALDVSIRAQVLNVLKEIKSRLSMTYVFISHDLAVVQYIADRVAVMYAGQIVEEGTVEQVIQRPGHPYTHSLLASVPRVDVSGAWLDTIQIEAVTQPSITGCPYRTRCPHAFEPCGSDPFPSELEDSHFVRCHLLNASSGHPMQDSPATPAAIGGQP